MKLTRNIWVIILVVIVILVGLMATLLASDSDNPNATDAPQSVTFDGTDGTYTLTVDYPEGWHSSSQSDFGIGITNDLELLQNLLAGAPATPESGQISGNIAFFSYDNLGTSVGITAEIDIEIALSAFVQSMSGGAASLDETELVTENGVPIATGVSSDGTSDTLFMTIQVERGLILGFFGTIAGELDQYRETLLSIMASSEFVDIADS